MVADAVRVARDAFAFSSPSPNALSTDGQVTVEIETLGLPPSWGVEVVLDGDEPGAMALPAPPFALVLGAIATGEHALQAFLVDAEGERVIAPPAEVAFGVGDRVLAFGDSLVQGTGDDDYSDNTSLDHRVSAKGFTPILNDLLTAGLGRPHSVAKDGAPGRQSAQASGLVAGVLAAHPEASRVLVLFGTNDAYWSQRPSGFGLLPGDAGYTDSFKDHMRRIVDAVIADGREPVVAKVPPFAGDFGGPTPLSTLNGLIDDYNLVVDELYVQVPLAVPPPDLHGHFAAFPGEYSDDAHPNGAGYQSMAAIWANALVP